MKKYMHLLILIQIIYQTHTLKAQIVWQENFESYVVDSIIDPQSADWNGWGGLYTSAIVSSDTSVSGSQSLKSWDAVVPGSSVPVSDVVHLFGNLTSGRYLLKFKIYVPSQDTNSIPIGSYYNILHDYQNNGGAGTEWALEVYMWPKGTSSYLRAGGINHSFNVKYDEWVQVAHIIDLDRDSADFYYGNKLIASHPFSYTSLTTSGKNQLSAIDIYAECSGSNCIPLAYFDDFVLRNLPDQSNDAGISDIIVPDYCKGFPTTIGVVIQNYGLNAIDSLQINWSIDGVIQLPVNFSSKALTSGDTAFVPLGSTIFGSNSNYNLKVWTSLPNNALDTVNYNDTLTLNVGKLKINGPRTVCPSIDFILTASGSGIGTTYEWQVFDSTSNIWVSTSNISKDYTVAGGITAPRDFRLISNCAQGGSDTSNVISVAIKQIKECYCSPEYLIGCIYGNNINSFQLLGVNNTSISDVNTGCSPNSYSNKTNLPPIDLVAGLTHHGSINSSLTSLSEFVKIWIDFNNDGIFEDSTELVGTVGPFSNSIVSFTINIPISIDSGIYRMRVRSVRMSNGFTFNACTSEIYGETHDYSTRIIIPNCKSPSNLSNTNTSTHSTGLTWLENGIATEWEIEYGLTGYSPGTGIRILSNNNPFIINNLNSNASYEFYVRSICGRNDTSHWAGPFSFQTSAEIPYFQDFENFPISYTGIKNFEAWNNTSFTQPQWHSSTTSNSSMTGPAFDKTKGFGGRFVYLETIGGVLGAYDELLSPTFYIDPAYSTVQFTFWYHMFGSNMGDMEVYIESNSTSSLITAINSQQHPNRNSPWTLFTTTLNGYQGQYIQLRFKGIRGSGINGKMAIDDVQLTTQAVGINDKSSFINTISIYPNPNKGIFHISGNTNNEIKISLFNVAGKEVYKLNKKLFNNFNYQIDLSNLDKGIYFVRIENEETFEMRKIVIQ